MNEIQNSGTSNGKNNKEKKKQKNINGNDGERKKLIQGFFLLCHSISGIDKSVT